MVIINFVNLKINKKVIFIRTEIKSKLIATINIDQS